MVYQRTACTISTAYGCISIKYWVDYRIITLQNSTLHKRYLH